jgi:hypothetical protein
VEVRPYRAGREITVCAPAIPRPAGTGTRGTRP